jgi:NitT/TauT family transport system ATP-binding protein
LLSFQSVGKSFASGVDALSGVSFGLARGEFLSLVGPSGCGKSTALRLIAGLTKPSSGTLAWAGERPRTGFVFQDAALMPWATVESNVRLPLELKGLPADADEKVAQALALVGLSGFARAYPRALSGGMRMRVSIARALAADAELLLMDEPFAALDELTRERLNDELRALWASRGLTVVFVTHSIYESVYLSSRVVVMSARPGRVVADIAMPSPQDRTPEFRLSQDYGERCRAVREALVGRDTAQGSNSP